MLPLISMWWVLMINVYVGNLFCILGLEWLCLLETFFKKVFFSSMYREFEKYHCAELCITVDFSIETRKFHFSWFNKMNLLYTCNEIFKIYCTHSIYLCRLLFHFVAYCVIKICFKRRFNLLWLKSSAI